MSCLQLVAFHFPEAQSFEAAVIASAKGDGKDVEAAANPFSRVTVCSMSIVRPCDLNRFPCLLI